MLRHVTDPGHASGVNSSAARAAPPGKCPPNNRGLCSDDQLFSWSQPYFHSLDSAYTGPSSDNPGGLSWKSVTPAEEAAHPLSDTQIADNAVNTLKQFRASGLSKPFFLACGFRTPQLVCRARPESLSCRSLIRSLHTGLHGRSPAPAFRGAGGKVQSIP